MAHVAAATSGNYRQGGVEYTAHGKGTLERQSFEICLFVSRHLLKGRNGWLVPYATYRSPFDTQASPRALRCHGLQGWSPQRNQRIDLRCLRSKSSYLRDATGLWTEPQSWTPVPVQPYLTSGPNLDAGGFLRGSRAADSQH